MSKIQAVNYQAQPKLAQPQANYAPAQSFGHGLSDLPEGVQKLLTKEVGTRIDQRLGRAGKFYRWLANWKGEKQTQLINAFFTTTLAPLMIAYNPFVKQDEKTKKYTALRQPISAGIALAVTLPLTVKLDRFMDNLYHNGHFSTIDLRMAPSKDTLTRAFYKNEKVGFFARIGKFLSGEENPKLDKFIADVQKERMDFFTALVTEDPKDIVFDEALKTIRIKGEDVQAKQKIRVPGFETKEALDKFLQANSFHKKTFGQFLKERFGFEFFPDGELKPNIAESRLSNIKAMDFLKEMGLIDDKVTETELRKALGVLQQSRKIKDVQSIFKGIKMSSKDASHLLEIVGKNTTRVTQLYMGEQLGKAKATTMGQFLHHLGISLSPEKEMEESLQDLIKQPMQEVLEGLGDFFKRFKVEGFKEDAKLNHFTKNILKNSTKRMESYAANYKGYTGIIFNLFTTAAACTILNWAYPRVMERFFPELITAGKKPEAEKGGNK